MNWNLNMAIVMFLCGNLNIYALENTPLAVLCYIVMVIKLVQYTMEKKNEKQSKS